MACNEQKEKSDLLRIVRTPDLQVAVDLTGKLNGRGAYICKSEECLNKIIKSKRLEKILEITISDEVYDNVRGIINGK